MRKRHQAFNISSKAKKEILNYINIENMSYEEELKESLKNYFSEKLHEEDFEEDENDKEDIDEEYIYEIETPNKHSNAPEIKKFYISEKAIISNFNEDIFEFIKDNNENEEINFNDLVENLNNDEFEKITTKELLNIDENQLLKYENKLNEIKDACKENNNIELINIIDNYIEEINKKKNDINYVINNKDKIDKISFNENGNIITFK